MKSFDIVIPIAENDVDALKYNLPYIMNKIGMDNKIIIVAKKTLAKQFDQYNNVVFIDEDSVIPEITYSSVRKWIEQRYPKAVRRTGWYFQQFLKWGYSRICQKDYYLTWDSDTIPLRELSFFNKEGKPYFDVIPTVKYDEVYEPVIKTFWENGEVKIQRNYSYITEHMIFNKIIVTSLINEIEKSEIKGNNFAEKIINAIPVNMLNLSGFSEFETYALYALSKYKDFYQLRKWRNLRNGRIFFGKEPSYEQLNWISDSFDVVSIEDFDKQFIICKIFCRNMVMKHISFEKVYTIVKPFIIARFKLRMMLRKIVRG